MGQSIFTEDRYLGEPLDATNPGAVLPVNLGISATWRSRWYDRSVLTPKVNAAFFGDQSATLGIETSWDSGTTVHNAFTGATASKTLPAGTRHVAEGEFRVLAPKFRFVVVNGGTAQSIARLFASTSSM